jgi:OPT oligopeptide transporter protein
MKDEWKPGWLPRVLPEGTVGYHVLLAAISILLLGPLGGITAAYMNYKLGTFVGGQVLAGILGSLVTYFYGPQGRHGANYMQSMAASVASMGAMGVLVQAMVWLDMPLPPLWQLVLYYLCIGMFGVGVGMLYTPVLVDTLKLTYPSGLAVANILRALTDVRLLRRSVGTLGGGLVGGVGGAALVERLQAFVEAQGARATLVLQWLGTASPVTIGGGMIVGARIATSPVLVGAVGLAMTPWLRAQGLLGEHDPFRRIGFIFALGTILGAAVVDLSLLARDALARVRTVQREGAGPATGPRTQVGRLLLWVAFWAAALAVVANWVFNVPLQWVAFALLAALVFQMINGISQGITDQNPISSAFVVSVLLMALMGLTDPKVGLLTGSILLVSCTVGVDMQQDRSTGWRLGSSRALQFRYQMIGVVMGALIAVVLAQVFLESFPVLKQNFFAHPELREGEGRNWQSAMTYKFVGVLNTLDKPKAVTLQVMALGIGVGLVIEVIRKNLFRHPRYLAWKVSSRGAKVADFVLDGVLLNSPYASSFGGFVEFETALWWGLGGAITSGYNSLQKPAPVEVDGEPLPEDMSSTSLVGGGLIAGESLFALYVGISSLVESGALGKLLGIG